MLLRRGPGCALQPAGGVRRRAGRGFGLRTARSAAPPAGPAPGPAPLRRARCTSLSGSMPQPPARGRGTAADGPGGTTRPRIRQEDNGGTLRGTDHGTHRHDRRRDSGGHVRHDFIRLPTLLHHFAHRAGSICTAISTVPAIFTRLAVRSGPVDGGRDAVDVAVVEVFEPGGEPFVLAVAQHELQGPGQAVECSRAWNRSTM
jgi:hypothetical protein